MRYSGATPFESDLAVRPSVAYRASARPLHWYTRVFKNTIGLRRYDWSVFSVMMFAVVWPGTGLPLASKACPTPLPNSRNARGEPVRPALTMNRSEPKFILRPRVVELESLGGSWPFCFWAELSSSPDCAFFFFVADELLSS